MSAFTNEGEAMVLQYLMRGTAINADGLAGTSAWTPSSLSGAADQGLYISLWTSATTTAHLEVGGTGGSEVSGSGYSRKFIDFTAISAVSASSDVSVGTDISGPETATTVSWTAGADWATGATTVKYFGLHLGSTTTNEIILYGELVDGAGAAAPKNVSNGDTVTLATDSLTITLK